MKIIRRLLGLFCMVLPLGACSPTALLNAFVPSEGYVLHRDIAYGDADRQVMDIYRPEDGPAGTSGDKSGDKSGDAPVVVYFYGGSWKSGSRRNYRFMGEALTRNGFVVAVPDYRLYPEVRFPEFVEDGARAVRWVSTHAREFGGDPGRIILMGHSAGAHIAALLAFDERYLAREGVPGASLRGFVGVAGPYAFDPLAYRSTKPIFSALADTDQARPITFVGGEEVAALLLHGADDRTVFPQNSRDFAARIRDAGGRVSLLEYDDTDHIKIILSFAALFRGRDTVYEDTIEFLKSL
jgi:acetyl esterase/lipase